MNANLKSFSLYWLFFLIMGIAIYWQHRERQRREAVAESLCATAEVGSEFFSNWDRLGFGDDVLDHILTKIETHMQYLKTSTDKLNVNKELPQFEANLIDIKHRVLYLTDSPEYAALEFDHFFANSDLTFQAVFSSKNKLSEQEIALWINSFYWRLGLYLSNVAKENLNVMKRSNPKYPRALFPNITIEQQNVSTLKIGDTVELGISTFSHSPVFWDEYFISINGNKVQKGRTHKEDTIVYVGKQISGRIDTLYIRSFNGLESILHVPKHKKRNASHD